MTKFTIRSFSGFWFFKLFNPLNKYKFCRKIVYTIPFSIEFVKPLRFAYKNKQYLSTITLTNYNNI